MSGYVLSRVFSRPESELRQAIRSLRGAAEASFALADINSLLSRFTPAELSDAMTAAPEPGLSPFHANYVAAMVETACERHAIPVPNWASRVPPLEDPWFGSTLASLRLHLLTHSPAPFRSRNIFIDSTLGGQV